MPFVGTIVYVTALDYWNAPQWLLGAVGLLLLIGWIGFIVARVNEEDVEIMSKWVGESDLGTNDKKKSRFKERLEEVIGKK